MPTPPIQIMIFSDTICPWCYIGKKRLELAMLERHNYNFNLRYLAFQLNPDMPEKGVDRKHYLRTKFGSDSLANNAYAPLRQSADELTLGFQLDNIKVTPNSVNSHMLIQYLQSPNSTDISIRDEFVESLFYSYFCKALDIGNESILKDLWLSVDKAGILPSPESVLSNSNLRHAVMEHQKQAYASHIGGVPFYIISSEKSESYTLSGAQLPQSFLPIFDLVAQSA